MGWLAGTFSASIGRKVLMALSGLFLCTFLVAHLAGNLQLIFIKDNGLTFNAYAAFMTSNPLIKAASYLTYLSILAHAFYGLYLMRLNANARPVRYAVSGANANSSWNSRNMGVLGTIVLVFIVIHMKNFWYEMHFGAIGVDANGNKDLFPVVQEAFRSPLYIIFYVLSMLAISFHLMHGFKSGFQTLGLNHPKYNGIIEKAGSLFALVVPLLFAAIPLYMHFIQ
jgi:succinate dehydrogenase / fumarate reductase cytochrome b subunit